MVVLMMLNLTLAAPIMAIGGIIMALRLDVPLSSVILVAVPVMGVFIGLVRDPCLAALQVDAEEDRPRQPGHARGAERRPRDPRLRPRRLRGAALRGGQRRPHRHDAEGDAAVRRHDAGPDPDPEPLDGRHRLVRQHPGRQPRHADRRPHGLPHLHPADPDVGAHGDHHVRHGAARLRLCRAHPAGAQRRHLGQRPRDAGRRRARARPRRVQRRGVPLPRRPGPRAVAHLLRERRPAR